MPPESMEFWQSMTWGGGLFVTVNMDFVASESDGAISKDGKNWTKVTLPYADPSLSGAWNGVTYSNGVFVAVAGALGGGDYSVAYSTNGLNWSSASLP